VLWPIDDGTTLAHRPAPAVGGARAAESSEGEDVIDSCPAPRVLGPLLHTAGEGGAPGPVGDTATDGGTSDRAAGTA
jgi:hypothetical protein